MSTTTLALLTGLANPRNGFVNDNNVALAGGGQAGARLCRSSITRFTKVASANDTAILPRTDDTGANIVWVLNDGANSLRVYCAAGEKMNGVSNSYLDIAAGYFGVFVLSKAAGDWRSAAVS